MKKLLSFLVLYFALCSQAFGQGFAGPVTANGIVVTVVANLPTGGINVGAVRFVTNTDGSSCTAVGSTTLFCRWTGSAWTPAGSGTITTTGGDVFGPASSVNGAVAVYSGTSGKLLAASAATFYTIGGTTVSVADGGTGSGTAAGARTNLGLVIGTNVLAPNGSAAALTSFPTLNQNTSGSAATLTTPRNINGVAFDGSANITITAAGNTITGTSLASNVVTSSLTSVGTITTGVWQATPIAAAFLAGSIPYTKLIGTDIITLGTVTTGGLGTGAVIGGVTMTLGSDATGDIYYRNSSGVLTRLGIGSTGQVLTVSGGLPGWATGSGGGGGSNPCTSTALAVQYNASGTLGCVSSVTSNGTKLIATSGGIDTTLPIIRNGIVDGGGFQVITFDNAGGAIFGTGPALFTYDTSSISALRTIKVPNADTILVVPSTAASNNFVTGINATTGVLITAQPTFANLSGAATDAQIPDGITLSQNIVTDYQDWTAISAPASPAAGKIRVYAKTSTNILCSKDSSGTENCVGGTGGGSGVSSVGLVGTANQINISGSSPITTSGTWTVSIPTNSQLSIAQIVNLTGNGIVTTSGGVGTLSVTATTGSANVVLSTSPTITTPTIVTSAVIPKIIGGSGTTQTLTFQTTSGTGATGADIIFLVGAAGGTEAMRIKNDGTISTGCSGQCTGPLDLGTLRLNGATSGYVAQTAGAAAAGAVAIAWGSSSGTPVVTASSPLVINTTTGDITCPTCATGTGVKQIFIPAAAFVVDGTNCTYPQQRTIASGQQIYTVQCADSNSSIFYWAVRMPSTWNFGTVTVTPTINNNTTESTTWFADHGTACRQTAVTWNNTYGTTQSTSIAITTANQNVEATSAAITANGTCAAGAWLLGRSVINAASNTAIAANANILGITIAATW